MTPTRFYEPDQMVKVADFFAKFKALVEEFEGGTYAAPNDEHPLYVFGGEIIIRHKDGWTLGRLAVDDFWYFENTEETYGEKTS